MGRWSDPYSQDGNARKLMRAEFKGHVSFRQEGEHLECAARGDDGSRYDSSIYEAFR